MGNEDHNLSDELVGIAASDNTAGGDNGMTSQFEYHPGGSQTACPICREDFLEGSMVSMLPCTHVFHGKCIMQWFVMSNTCPLFQIILP